MEVASFTSDREQTLSPAPLRRSDFEWYISREGAEGDVEMPLELDW